MTGLSLGSILISYNMSRVAIFIILCEYGYILFSWQNPRLLDDVSFHPCIRFKRWESERVLSFIPPDGNFRLISYRVSSQKYVDASNLLPSNINVLGKTDLSLFYSYSWILEFIIVPDNHGSPRKPRTSETMCLK